MSDAVELEPCPFCGTTEHLSTSRAGSAVGGYYGFVVRCHHLDCDNVVGPSGNGKFEAIAAWNRRAKPEGEPVAWQYRSRKADGSWGDWYFTNVPSERLSASAGGAQVQPLYTRPTAWPDREAVAGEIIRAIEAYDNSAIPESWDAAKTAALNAADAILALPQAGEVK